MSLHAGCSPVRGQAHQAEMPGAPAAAAIGLGAGILVPCLCCCRCHHCVLARCGRLGREPRQRCCCWPAPLLAWGGTPRQKAAAAPFAHNPPPLWAASACSRQPWPVSRAHLHAQPFQLVVLPPPCYSLQPRGRTHTRLSSPPSHPLESPHCCCRYRWGRGSGVGQVGQEGRQRQCSDAAAGAGAAATGGELEGQQYEKQ
eukprot:scaffold206647_cov17-Tisochrysis_lutea.AAC.1